MTYAVLYVQFNCLFSFSVRKLRFGGRFIDRLSFRQFQVIVIEGSSYLRFELSKNRVIKKSSCQRIELSTIPCYRNVELSKCRVIEMSSYQSVELSKCRVYRTVELSNCRVIEVSSYRSVEFIEVVPRIFFYSVLLAYFIFV